MPATVLFKLYFLEKINKIIYKQAVSDGALLTEGAVSNSCHRRYPDWFRINWDFTRLVTSNCIFFLEQRLNSYSGIKRTLSKAPVHGMAELPGQILSCPWPEGSLVRSTCTSSGPRAHHNSTAGDWRTLVGGLLPGRTIYSQKNHPKHRYLTFFFLSP